MSYSARMQGNHLYSVYFSPRGSVRMADLGMQIAQQYLSPFDLLVGVIGKAGSGKSMLIRGMFPGLELTNDDGGVNMRPLPLMCLDERSFYNAHTFHVDVRFEMAFTQIADLASAITNAIALKKRVVVEHFDMIYPYLKQNAHLLIGLGEEIIVTRPTLFGPDPKEISDVVFQSIDIRRKVHSAEDLCEFCLLYQGVSEYEYEHADVRHGFILRFEQEPSIDLNLLEDQINAMITDDMEISFCDENHIYIGETKHHCTGPRMHVHSTGCIERVYIMKELYRDNITGRYMLLGSLDSDARERIDKLNRIETI